MKCDECRWWLAFTQNGRPSGRGDCHRYPPQSVCLVDWIKIEGDYEARCDVDDFYPTTDSDDFCGEFTPKEKP